VQNVVFTFFTFLAWNPLAAGKTPEGISLWAGATLWSFGHKQLAKSGVAPAQHGAMPRPN
jgi:hypothetical protein